MKHAPMKWEQGGLKAPLARARGLGSARSGVHHWIAQRITALAVLPLLIWLFWSFLSLQGTDHAGFTAWVASPITSILLLLTIMGGLYYCWLEIQLVLEDYIHAELPKTLAIWLTQIALIFAGVAGIFSVLKLSLGV